MGEQGSEPLLFKIQGRDAMRSGPLELMAEVGGVVRNVVIDTGAEVNVIAQDFVWQNAWKEKVKVHKEKILGISNTPIVTDGKLELDVSIQGATVTVTFLVIPITNVFAILGIDFAQKHEVRLEFKPKNPRMIWRPNGQGKLREVPLTINTQAPQLSIRRQTDFIIINPIRNASNQQEKQTDRKTARIIKKFSESYDKNSEKTSSPRRSSDELSETKISMA